MARPNAHIVIDNPSNATINDRPNPVHGSTGNGPVVAMLSNDKVRNFSSRKFLRLTIVFSNYLTTQNFENNLQIIKSISPHVFAIVHFVFYLFKLIYSYKETIMIKMSIIER